LTHAARNHNNKQSIHAACRLSTLIASTQAAAWAKTYALCNIGTCNLAESSTARVQNRLHNPTILQQWLAATSHRLPTSCTAATHGDSEQPAWDPFVVSADSNLAAAATAATTTQMSWSRCATPMIATVAC